MAQYKNNTENIQRQHKESNSKNLQGYNITKFLVLKTLRKLPDHPATTFTLVPLSALDECARAQRSGMPLDMRKSKEGRHVYIGRSALSH